jgi:hypothetical protein
MTQEMLNHLMILHTHREATDKMDISEADEFVSSRLDEDLFLDVSELFNEPMYIYII